MLGCEHVEGPHTEHIEAGVNTGADVDGHNHDDGVVKDVPIRSKGINYWPPFHFPVNHERHSESRALIKVDQVLLGVMGPLLVDGSLVISFIQFILCVQIGLDTDFKSVQHYFCLFGSCRIFAGSKLKQFFVVTLAETFLTFCLVKLGLEIAMEVNRQEEESDVGGEFPSKGIPLLLFGQDMDVGSESNDVKVFVKSRIGPL